jgi:exportin-T
MTTEKLAFLTSFLKVVIEKLKWDPDTSPDDLDQDERAAFESMRKVCGNMFLDKRALTSRTSQQDLRKFIDAVLVLDVEIVTQALSDHAHRVLIEYENGTQLTWVDAELAIYLVYLYGELGIKEKGEPFQRPAQPSTCVTVYLQDRVVPHFALYPKISPKQRGKTLTTQNIP